jgi:hypothetical protein
MKAQAFHRWTTTNAHDDDDIYLFLQKQRILNANEFSFSRAQHILNANEFSFSRVQHIPALVKQMHCEHIFVFLKQMRLHL